MQTLGRFLVEAKGGDNQTTTPGAVGAGYRLLKWIFAASILVIVKDQAVGSAAFTERW